MQHTLTELPFPFRLLNTLGAVPGVTKLVSARLEADALLYAATKQTGLTDFGEPGFLDGLRVLLESAERDARLHFMGRLTICQVVVDDLVNRLLLTEAKKCAPELFARPLRPPLIILGLPRSGTTFLHRLLAENPAHYAPRYWQLARPLPQPGKRDDRYRKATQELGLRKRMTKELDSKHFITADTPEECLLFLSSTFEGLLYWVLAPVYGYLEWYLGQNHERKYREYRAWLQVLQAFAPGRRLVLKAPEHAGALAALLHVVPEAHVIQTHRDPTVAFTSFASLNLTTQRLVTRTIDVQRSALASLKLLEEELKRNLRDREARAGAVYDVLYDDLIVDPKGTVRAIYDHYGLTVTDAYRTNLERYIRENPQGKHGTHRYAASDFGLTDDVVRQRFTSYNERFGFAI